MKIRWKPLTESRKCNPCFSDGTRFVLSYLYSIENKKEAAMDINQFQEKLKDIQTLAMQNGKRFTQSW